LAALAFLFLACGSPGPTAPASLPPSPTSVGTGSAPATPSAFAQPVLSAADSRYGRIIVDGSGRTLYLFDLERDPTPRCYGACAVGWPPLLGSRTVGVPELNQALIATVVRKGGSKQLTYSGHPLYFYAGDQSAGDINCQAVTEFGGGWYVIDVNGNRISTP
jgi:predicted lipoprotein with Yx(FWY)xxD motif